MKIILNGFRLTLESEQSDTLLASMIFDIIEKKCTTYVPISYGKQSIIKPDKQFFFRYKKDGNDVLVLHSNQLIEIEKILRDNAINYHLDEKVSTYKFKPISCKLAKGIDFRDDLQREYNEYLLVDRPAYLCALQTGKGKTGSTIISLLKRKHPSRLLLLIPPRFNVIWLPALQKFTTMTDEDILFVSGREALYDLVNIPDNIAAVVMSPPTLREYFKDYYDGVDVPVTPEDLMKAIGSEYMIIDETHLDFNNNYLNVIGLNPSKLIMLTASYESGKDAEKIRKFKNVIIPKEDRMKEQELDKYVNIVFCQFRFDEVEKMTYSNSVMKWYNHAMLESSIMKKSTKYNNYFEMIIYFANRYYSFRTNHRLLFLFSTKEMVRNFYLYLKKHNTYGKRRVVTFIQGDPRSNLTADIIISTDKSSGTGVDIENVQTAVNTISTESEYNGIQFSGRPRYIGDVEQYYLTLWCTNIAAQNKYKKSNYGLFMQRAKSIINEYYADKSI